MARRRRRKQARKRPRKEAPVSSYADAEGNELVLRRELSPGSVTKIREGSGRPAANLEDEWARREEMLFERLAVRWDAGGVPLEEQKMLLGRFRMAAPEERRWLRETIAAHCERWFGDRL